MSQTESGVKRRKSYNLCDHQFVPYKLSRLFFKSFRVFADDTRLYTPIYNVDNCDSLQSDLQHIL